MAGFLREDIPTLVFCSAGLSRTPAIAGAAAARVRGLSLEEGVGLVVGEGPADLAPGLLAQVREALT